MSEYKLMYVRGHIEVFDRNGCFLFSADTMKEAEEDLRDWLAA